MVRRNKHEPELFLDWCLSKECVLLPNHYPIEPEQQYDSVYQRFYYDNNNRIGQLPQREANVCPAQLHSLPDLQGGVVCVFDSSKTDSRTISNAETDSKEKLMDLQG